ncbi:MAG TPA: cob(I)yrinic acid a,c-diamide adenosyltransferase [Phycisphaerales bacterium]|jgi:cob(I)alamin adenosyltransferase|nr:cob(I)yrinic acid a,c-diamide adenosyltransferase [Phycisphaerales bacterium]
MSLYTRTGDDGTTGLHGGGRIEKDSVRMNSVGDVDELNACIGLVASEKLQPLQALLFELGADLATPPPSSAVRRLTDSDIKRLEKWIDQVDGENDPLHSFVLPGGSDTAARLHLARAICRRAERSVTTLYRESGCSVETLVVLNRISDFLFAMARCENKLAGIADIPWQPDKGNQA